MSLSQRYLNIPVYFGTPLVHPKLRILLTSIVALHYRYTYIYICTSIVYIYIYIRVYILVYTLYIYIYMYRLGMRQNTSATHYIATDFIETNHTATFFIYSVRLNSSTVYSTSTVCTSTVPRRKAAIFILNLAEIRIVIS